MTSKKKIPPAKIFVSKPVEVNAKNLEGMFTRADLEIYGLDISTVSYRARIFINNPKATIKTPTNVKNRYVGHFTVFGHGGCYGDPGHCDVPPKQRFFDYRASHPLSSAYESIEIPKQLYSVLLKNKKITITIIPIVTTLPVVESRHMIDLVHVLKFDELRLVTYS